MISPPSHQDTKDSERGPFLFLLFDDDEQAEGEKGGEGGEVFFGGPGEWFEESGEEFGAGETAGERVDEERAAEAVLDLEMWETGVEFFQVAEEEQGGCGLVRCEGAGAAEGRGVGDILNSEF